VAVVDRGASGGQGGDVMDLDAEFRRLVSFGPDVVHPDGGAAWLDDDGEPLLDRPVLVYSTARMAHVHALAAMAGIASSEPLADALLAALAGPLRDAEHGGWRASSVSDAKAAYDHAFVLLAASTATVAGHPAGPALLRDALTAHERFWEPDAGMVCDLFDGTWARRDDYRGLNANMHTVEALLAAADATDDPRWRERALRIAATGVERWGRAFGWRLPEHFTPAWEPMPEHHRDRPDDPFQPYGATIGHGLEWSRLLLHLEAALGPGAPAWLRPAAAALYDRAVTDGWAADGADGFVYTTDWSGQPVVHDRMWWVAAEGAAAAAALHAVAGDPRHAAHADRFWAFIEEFHVDRERGSWVHQLDRHNRHSPTVWPGKPDLYHAVQATLVPRLPLAPGMARAIREGRLA
jgi:mannose/cellobiose epimerase-like protein (N-acyl-D-glucosamine 2-epimerase family)